MFSKTLALPVLAMLLNEPKFVVAVHQKDQSPLTAEETTAFVKAQFSHYFTDCQKFVKSFGNNFRYCDFAHNKPELDCLTQEEDLLGACEATQGAPTIIYELEPKPAFTGVASNYNEVAIKGFQKVFGVPVPDPATGAVTVMDMCFDMVVVETLQRAPTKTLGIESTYWKGYYSVEFCGIPGAPDCSCDSRTAMVSYNMPPSPAPQCTDCDSSLAK